MEHINDDFVDNQISGIQLELLGRTDRLFHAIGTPLLKVFVAAENKWDSVVGREPAGGDLDALGLQQERIQCGKSAVALSALSVAALGVFVSRRLLVDPHGL